MQQATKRVRFCQPDSLRTHIPRELVWSMCRYRPATRVMAVAIPTYKNSYLYTRHYICAIAPHLRSHAEALTPPPGKPDRSSNTLEKFNHPVTSCEFVRLLLRPRWVRGNNENDKYPRIHLLLSRSFPPPYYAIDDFYSNFIL